MPRPKRDSLGGMDDIARHSIEDLCRKSPGSAPDDRFAFPHGFRHGKTESFFDRFLKDDRGSALQCVDFKVCLGRQLQHMNVGIVGNSFLDFSQDRFAFSIMHDPRPGKDQTAILVFLDQSIGLDRTERILEPLKPRQLQQNRLVLRDAKALKDLMHLEAGHGSVLCTQGINRR